LIVKYSKTIIIKYNKTKVYHFLFLSSNLVTEAHTIKCGEVECPEFSGPYINYAMSLPIELNLRGQQKYTI